MAKSILVIGANGMLGYAVSKYFRAHDYHIGPVTRKEFDIAKDSIEQLENAVESADLVINCAGVVISRIKETPIEDILKVNGIFPRNLATLCNKHRTPCFHIATDCVFSGKRGMYSESDYFDAEDVYGLSKCAGDTANCMVLRTSIIGEDKNNSRGLLEWVRSEKGNTINGWVNHLWNGLTTVYLAEAIHNILTMGLYESGIFHIFSDRVVSKFELVSMINEIYDLGIKINMFETPDSCDRSLCSEKALCKKVIRKSLKTQIEEMKSFFEKIQKNSTSQA